MEPIAWVFIHTYACVGRAGAWTWEWGVSPVCRPSTLAGACMHSPGTDLLKTQGASLSSLNH